MPKAFSLLPTRFEDGRNLAIEEGLRQSGFEVIHGGGNPSKGDLLVTWNLYGSKAQMARSYEKAGARALVAEEAHIRIINGEKYFQLAFGGHNGAGKFRVGGPERWNEWNIPIKPWRKNGNHILVAAQRGFGYNNMAMPDSWPRDILSKLRRVTSRPIWFRAHPKLGDRAQKPEGYNKLCDITKSLDYDFQNAWACVVYTSGVATHALMEGIPVFYDGPKLLSYKACEDNLARIEIPRMLDRIPAFHDVSWSQWSMNEIRSGEAIRWLLKY